jgi:hypothetical protein
VVDVGAAICFVVRRAAALHEPAEGCDFAAENHIIEATSLCYRSRPAWRRVASLAWNRWLFTRLCDQLLLRISLHPSDFQFEPIRRQVLELVKMALAHGYKAATYAEYAEG